MKTPIVDMKRSLMVTVLVPLTSAALAQLKWTNVDSLFLPLPKGVHVYKTKDPLDGKPNIAYYVEADLRNRDLEFTTDTSSQRRLTPAQFFIKNDNPMLVVNCTFFSFQTNQNLNVVIRNGKMLGFNTHAIPGRGKDTLTYLHTFGGAIGISKKRTVDVAWLYTDSARRFPLSTSQPTIWRDSARSVSLDSLYYHNVLYTNFAGEQSGLKKWKMKTAVGGGPILIQNSEIKISNNEERKFAGNAINDRHPRTAMGYTVGQKLIILVVEGRNPGKAEGATLVHLAEIFKQLNCYEALNLDGGGSSCLLVNGKQTIKPSDANGQRPVPAVFLIKTKD